MNESRRSIPPQEGLVKYGIPITHFRQSGSRTRLAILFMSRRKAKTTPLESTILETTIATMDLARRTFGLPVSRCSDGNLNRKPQNCWVFGIRRPKIKPPRLRPKPRRRHKLPFSRSGQCVLVLLSAIRMQQTQPFDVVRRPK